MTALTSAGTTIGISAGVPASQNDTGYSALTYTTVGGVESLPAFGADTQVTSYQPLNGPVEKHKGSTNYGSITLPMAYDKADAGQNLVRAAAAPSNNALYAFVVTFPNGDKRYYQGRVFGAPDTVGGANNVIMSNAKIEICTAIVKVDAV